MTERELQDLRDTRVRRDRMALMAIVLFASVFPVELFPGPHPDVRGTDGQFSARQGQVLIVPLSVQGQPTEVTGQFFGRRVPFFSDSREGEAQKFLGLLGVDLQDDPGTHELVVEVSGLREPKRFSYNILVIKEQFPAQHLTLPREKVDLDPDTLARVKAEQDQVRGVLEEVSANRFWKGKFIEPVQGPTTGSFGRVRIINGRSHNPHSGEDIAAPQGADVLAMNDGVARLTVDHFFSGKGVFVDHGLGLHSMYFHLSDVLVRDGQPVTRGQVIGKVGATGRATGPHLHWGVRLNGARVNPYSLIELPLDGEEPTPR